MKPKYETESISFPQFKELNESFKTMALNKCFAFENSEILFDTFVLDDLLLIDLYFSTNYSMI